MTNFLIPRNLFGFNKGFKYFMNLVAIFLCAYFASVLASLGGVGGGGILIPLFAFFGDIQIKEAVILSIVTIVGSNLVRAIAYGAKRHRNMKNRFMPDYNVIRLVVPFDGNTAYLGFLLNKILPGYIITGGIVLLLCILIYKMIRKSIDLFRRVKNKDAIFIIVDNIEIEIDPSDEEEVEDRPGESWIDFFNYMIFTLLPFTLVTFFTIIRNISGYTWLVYGFQVGIIGLFGYMTVRNISLIYENRRLQSFRFVEGDIVWDRKSFIKYFLAASFTGFISTMLGIGGSMIMNPIMISLEMMPEVVLATNSIIGCLSAITSASQFILNEGNFEWYYGVLMSIGAVAAGTSLILLHFLRKQIRIVITIGLTLILSSSMIMLVITNIISLTK